MIQAIVTDIEGTTTSLSFVHQVLFPYARRHLGDFLRQHHAQPEVACHCHAVAQEIDTPKADLDTIIHTLETWIAQDRKITALKALQGLLWEQGYRNGDYTGHIYPDVAYWLPTWHQHGIQLYVYSSGSVQAQKLLFQYTEYGDFSALFQGFFDTLIGAKREPSAYQAIVEAIALPAESILFLSDICAELAAARESGMRTVLLARPENPPTDCPTPKAHDFNQVNDYVTTTAS